MSRDSKSNWNHGLRLWLTLLLIIGTIERIAVSKTNKKKQHYISSIRQSHPHTISNLHFSV